jgi:chemotaxis protein methyltransferase CheR
MAYKKIDLSERSFRRLNDIIYFYSGISLNRSKMELVKNRLRKHMKKLNAGSFNEYCELLESKEGKAEIPRMIDAISTNITSFFRERAHFRYLYEHALPAISEALPNNNQIRIWSAACSSGEEPYTIAMVANSFFEGNRPEVKILGTDICGEVLEKAKDGVYAGNKIEDVPDYFKKHFKNLKNGFYKIDHRIMEMAHFGRLNLIRSEYPFKGKFDIIFCRNVMIYFDEMVQNELIGKFMKHLNKGGFLFLGHAESLKGRVNGLKYVAPAVYRKVT